MHVPAARRGASLVALLVLLAGCINLNPSPSSSPSSAAPSGSAAAAESPSGVPSPTEVATPAPTVPAEFPLAVVSGMTNLKATIGLDELSTLAERGRLLVPCGVTVQEPALAAPEACREADRIGAWLEAHQNRVALLPPGLVEPTTKVLSIAGDGPFGMFGPDLFGDRGARALDYPVIGSPSDGSSTGLDPDWFAYDASRVWNLTSIGSLCSSPLVADQAVKNGLGWGWTFNGGTARYPEPEVIDPPDGGPYAPYQVHPVATGNDGATPDVLKRSDLAIADHECPIEENAGWAANYSGSLVFSVPEAVVVQWKRKLGLDAVYLAANHMSDRGVPGIESTLRILDQHNIPHTGLGMNLRQALQPAFLEVAGLRVALVAWNDVNGVARADAITPGVPWITRQNVNRAVRLAREGGADLVICDPQWWGGAEYHDDLWPVQRQQLAWFDRAGCDHVIGSGTHVAGPMLLRQRDEGGPSVVLASPGNFMFGQNWWQEVDEGVILDMSFSGTRLVNVRLRPYVMYLHARASLTDPQGAGSYVLQRILKYSEIDSIR
ncbi:MAG TPA: CapA family protein [Candidatus Limnocylindria bacterium]|nr:CapA family protein [Candidatus Limnocylindria bacterium]